MEEEYIEIDNIDNTNNNKVKEYNDETNNKNEKTKNKTTTKKVKKKVQITQKSSNQKENNINNDSNKEKGKENEKEEKQIDVIIQDNKSSKKETIEDILNKEITKKKLPPIYIEEKKDIEESKKEDLLIDNSVSTQNMDINKYLRMQISEKTQQIEELSLSQDINKNTLTDILKKLNITIKTNAELLYSGLDILGNEEKKNENKIDKESRMKELNILLENKKKELNISKETNKNFKNKYENMMKEINTSSSLKIEFFQKKIDMMKSSNSDLNKKIHILNYNNHLRGKKLDLNTKKKNNNEIKNYSDIYATLMKEKYNQYVKLNSNKKLIKDIMEQFQYLIKIINNEDKNKVSDENEKNNVKIININIDTNKIKDLKMKEDINNLQKDLSGNEQDIYNRVVDDKTITLGNYNKIKNRPMSIINKNKSIKKIKINIPAISKNSKINKNKKLVNSKSCNDILPKDKSKENIETNEININININNINNDDINFNEINYDNLTNHDYEKITNKREKYYNLDEKLDKSIKDLSIFYENKIKDINTILDINSKKLSNIQQENELLKSKITDMRRILELNIKEQKLLKQNLRYKNNNLIEKIITKNNKIENQKEKEKEKEKFDISEIRKNLEIQSESSKNEYINMLKEKYKVKKRVPYQDNDIHINSNDIDYNL